MTRKEKVKELFKRKGTNGRRVCKRAGVTRNSLYNLYDEYKYCRIDTLECFAGALDMKLSEFIAEVFE